MKFSHKQLTIISGSIWLLIGIWLLNIGIRLLLEPFVNSHLNENEVVLRYLGQIFGGFEQAALLLLVLALFVGYVKGKKILGRSAKEGIKRILSLPNPSPLSLIYSKKYYFLLLGMIGLGILVKVLNVPNDLRGFIDTAIGSALINGSMVYFQSAFQLKKDYL